RCRSFSADADGYVRAEGAGVVVLERLSDAQQKGRRILAIIRGSAVNQSGRSNGMAAPNGLAQQEVIRKALARGGVAPAEVGFVECFGTATALGDPIEVQALGAVLAEGRSPDSPVVLGTLKTNLGHMEGAAGVAGLIKAVLALQHERIPRNLHFTSPNRHIPWAELPVKVATETLSWPRQAKPRFAGVSSFGIAGTNAHVVLEEGPVVDRAPSAPPRAAELVVLSAKTPAALRAAAGRLHAHLEQQPALELGQLAQALIARRSLLECRLALSVTSRSTLLAELARVAQGQAPLSGALERVADTKLALAWRFSGAGAARPGMGRELAAQWPAFRAALDSVCRCLDPALEQPLREVMWAAPGAPLAKLLERADYAALASFAFEWAHACSWQSWGIEPAVVFGDAGGEIAAACCAGVFSIEDGSRLLLAQLLKQSELPSIARSIQYHAPRRSLRLADRHGEIVGEEVQSSEYWARNQHEALPLTERTLSGAASAVLELGSARLAVLHGEPSQPQRVSNTAAPTTASEAQAVLAALAGWVARGGAVDWAALLPGTGAEVELPCYPWQRERYWAEAGLAAPAPSQLLLQLRELLAASNVSPTAVAALPEIVAALAGSSSRANAQTARGADGSPVLGAEHLEGLAPEERGRRLLQLVQAEAARTLSIGDSEALPRQTPLLQLGMDSFMAVELRTRLEQRTGLPATSGLALDPALTTVTTLVRDLELLLDAQRAQQLPRIDLTSRTTLDSDLRALSAPLASLEPTSVLLTGATGFLGAFLLTELLTQTQARITCLVRAESSKQGMERLERNLRAYGLTPAHWRSRVTALVGDLAQPRLGLSEIAFRSLAREIDAIVSNGSHVSYVAGYAELEPAHVHATREVLRLASEGRPKAVHHVSSTAVFDSLAYRGQTLDERSIPTDGDGLELPYSQCKWVSEALVREAMARGIPATIHRPSFIGGATNGAWNTTDFLCRIFKGGLIGLGYFPEDLELLFDFTPVDTVARSIVHLSRQTAARGRIFHLQHPTGVTLSELVRILRSMGYSLEPLPYVEWLARIAKDKASPLYPLTGFLAYRSPADGLTALERSQLGYRPVFDGEATARELATAGIQFPALDRALFYRYFAGLASVGFLSEPTATVNDTDRR
ncbi:MAG: epothilone polyketide synthase, partial [Pseudomonadota bacterium]